MRNDIVFFRRDVTQGAYDDVHVGELDGLSCRAVVANLWIWESCALRSRTVRPHASLSILAHTLLSGATRSGSDEYRGSSRGVRKVIHSNMAAIMLAIASPPVAKCGDGHGLCPDALAWDKHARNKFGNPRQLPF